jgi:hypothetical protein
VVGQPGEWALYVARGLPYLDETIEVHLVPLPGIPELADAGSDYCQFIDWDGDGSTDLLAGVQKPRKHREDPWQWTVYRLWNTARGGEPRYAPPVRLLDIPGAWHLNGNTVDDSPLAGTPASGG